MGRGHQAGSLGQLGDRILTAVGGEKKRQCSIFNNCISGSLKLRGGVYLECFQVALGPGSQGSGNPQELTVDALPLPSFF